MLSAVDLSSMSATLQNPSLIDAGVFPVTSSIIRDIKSVAAKLVEFLLVNPSIARARISSTLYAMSFSSIRAKFSLSTIQ